MPVRCLFHFHACRSAVAFCCVTIKDTKGLESQYTPSLHAKPILLMTAVRRTNAISAQGKNQYWHLIGVGAFFLFLLTIGSRRMNPKQTEQINSLEEMSTDKIDIGDGNLEIVSGSVNSGHEVIASYQCSGQGIGEVDSSDDSMDLILLHGARFTKEDWKTSGILEKFCSIPTKKLRVTALDLNHKSNFVGLKSTIGAMKHHKMIHPTKKVAIITPSASGHSMVDWAENDPEGMVSTIEHWIPVACPSVLHAEINVLQKFQPLHILAAYGSEDELMIPASELLNKHAGAEVVEIQGGHPCYFDSPDRFINVVSNFIEKS